MPTATRGERWGTADDAGRLCVTPDAPDGVTGRTYRVYTYRYGAPRWERRDEQTGLQLFDLDKVRAWHVARPGAGRRSLAESAATIPRRTDNRARVMTAAAAGDLNAPDGIRQGSPLLLAGRTLTSAEKYAVTELYRAGLIQISGDRLAPSDRGRTVLELWDAATPVEAVS